MSYLKYLFEQGYAALSKTRELFLFFDGSGLQYNILVGIFFTVYAICWGCTIRRNKYWLIRKQCDSSVEWENLSDEAGNFFIINYQKNRTRFPIYATIIFNVSCNVANRTFDTSHWPVVNVLSNTSDLQQCKTTYQ